MYENPLKFISKILSRKQRLHKKTFERNYSLSKENKNKKTNSMVVNITKMSQKMKKKNNPVEYGKKYKMRNNTLLQF